MVSSKSSGDLKGALAFISMTCNWSSFPKVKCGNSTKFTTLPQKSFMTLSTMGKACSSSLTRENSCSGPKTSSGLYVAFPLFYLAIRSEYVYSPQSILNMTANFLTSSYPFSMDYAAYSRKTSVCESKCEPILCYCI